MRSHFLAPLVGIAFLIPSPLLAGPRIARQRGLPRPVARHVWSGLVVATNAPRPHEAPAQMHHIEPTLRRTFGYNQFDLIGVSHKALQSGEPNWLATSKHFSIRVDPRGVSR